MVDTTDEWIVERTGIHERRIAAADQATSDLAVGATAALLRAARMSASDLDLLIVATTTPDYILPPTATLVADRLGATAAGAVDMNAVCSGFVYALAHGTAMVEAGFARRVMVIGAETLSRIVNWEDTAAPSSWPTVRRSGGMLPNMPLSRHYLCVPQRRLRVQTVPGTGSAQPSAWDATSRPSQTRPLMLFTGRLGHRCA